MATIETKTKRHPSDLPYEEWSSITPLLPKPAKRGRKRSTGLRKIMNAIRYTVRSGVLTVSTSPDFAAKWLVNRLGRFAEAHPEIDLRIAAQMHHVDFAREDVDLAVRHGDGNWPGLAAVSLCPEELFAVGSPMLLAGDQDAGWPAKILQFPLLHYSDRNDWSKWLDAAGLADRQAVHGPVFNHASMLIDAAVNGQGIALARTSLAAWDLLNRRLIRLLSITLPVSRLYWIVCPQAASTIPKIVTFRDWLQAEAAADLRLLSTMPPVNAPLRWAV